jgi:Ca2+-binding RTX toxin-like protein
MTLNFSTTDSDKLLGDDSNDSLEGNAGDDIISGGSHDDSLVGDTGDDRIYGGDHDDLLEGGSGDDFLQGGNQNDILQGNSGDDLLRGGSHDDLLNGGSGNDSLNGSVGQDTLVGSDGANNFIFTSLDSFDVIIDFDANRGDKIIFDSASTGVAEISDLIVHAGVSYNNTGESNRTTSLYVDGEKVVEFDSSVFLQVEDFEFV